MLIRLHCGWCLAQHECSIQFWSQFLSFRLPQISQMHRRKEIRVRERARRAARSASTRKPRRRHRRSSAARRSLDTFPIRLTAASTTCACSAEPCSRAAPVDWCTVTSCRRATGRATSAVKCEKSSRQCRHQLERWHLAFPSQVASASRRSQPSRHRALQVHLVHRRQLTFNRSRRCHRRQTSRESHRIRWSRRVVNRRATCKKKFLRWVFELV